MKNSFWFIVVLLLAVSGGRGVAGEEEATAGRRDGNGVVDGSPATTAAAATAAAATTDRLQVDSFLNGSNQVLAMKTTPMESASTTTTTTTTKPSMESTQNSTVKVGLYYGGVDLIPQLVREDQQPTRSLSIRTGPLSQ